jgi:hypothetical protein
MIWVVIISRYCSCYNARELTEPPPNHYDFYNNALQYSAMWTHWGLLFHELLSGTGLQFTLLSECRVRPTLNSSHGFEVKDEVSAILKEENFNLSWKNGISLFILLRLDLCLDCLTVIPQIKSSQGNFNLIKEIHFLDQEKFSLILRSRQSQDSQDTIEVS